MKESLSILFFGKVFLLTPNPVTFERSFELVLDEPVSAVNGGASLRIDVTRQVGAFSGVVQAMRAADGEFPDGCLTGTLYGEDGDLELRQKGSSVSEDSIHLILAPESSVPVGVEYRQISITSCKRMVEVQMYWRNYAK